MKTELTIGIPAKNEEGGIGRLLRSLARAITKLDKNTLFEIIICVNGTTDDTLGRIEKFKKTTTGKQLQLMIIHSQPGKINAQRAIISERKLNGYLCFIDADCEISEMSLASMVLEMDKDSKLQAISASICAKQNPKPNLFERFRQVHWDLQPILKKRKFLFGRVFITRSHDCFFVQSKYDHSKHPFAKTLQLEKGFLVDDVFISRHLYHVHGDGCIKESADAVVYFTPENCMRDQYYYFRRLFFEFKRLDILFPEHVKLEKKVFKRTVEWDKIRKLSLFPIIHFFAYKSYELLLKKVVIWEIETRCRLKIAINDYWKPLKSTKKGGYEHEKDHEFSKVKPRVWSEDRK